MCFLMGIKMMCYCLSAWSLRTSDDIASGTTTEDNLKTGGHLCWRKFYRQEALLFGHVSIVSSVINMYRHLTTCSSL